MDRLRPVQWVKRHTLLIMFLAFGLGGGAFLARTVETNHRVTQAAQAIEDNAVQTCVDRHDGREIVRHIMFEFLDIMEGHYANHDPDNQIKVNELRSFVETNYPTIICEASDDQG